MTSCMTKKILVSCVLAAASAGYVYPQHIPVIDSRGVPVEPLENQAARAAHYAALAEASARTGTYSPVVYSAPIVASVPAIAGVSASALPVDTPEVAAARIQHFHDYAVAAQRNGVHVAAPVTAFSSYPVDTPEVQLAKAAHFAAHAVARSGVHLRKRRDVYAYPVINNGVPVNTPEVQRATAEHLAAHAAITGVPLDTPEVAAAKANHFAAHRAALTRSGSFVAAVAPYYYGSFYPHATIGPDGHPVETPEVQLAKAAHFAAHFEAAGRG